MQKLQLSYISPGTMPLIASDEVVLQLFSSGSMRLIIQKGCDLKFYSANSDHGYDKDEVVCC